MLTRQSHDAGFKVQTGPRVPGLARQVAIQYERFECSVGLGLG